MLLGDILKWPTVDESDFVWLILFLFFMGFTFFVINFLFRKQKAQTDSKGFAYSEIIGRNFSPEESKIMKKFIDKLSAESKELLATTRNWKALKKQVFDYLVESGSSPEIAVRIYDRLYIQKAADHSFHKGDLEPGELVALITEFGEELTRILKSTEEDVLLASQKTKIPPMTKGVEGKIYVFRPREGGYYIKGEIVGNMNEAVLFHMEGRPEHAGHAHLMIQEKFQIEVANWPRRSEEEATTKSKGVFEEIIRNDDAILTEELNSLELEIRKRFGTNKIQPPKADNSRKFSNDQKEIRERLQINKNIEFFCLALKLSDRGLLFELPEEINSEFWKTSDLWELKFQMPGGRYIETKAKIFPATGGNIRFIAKFVDMDESLRIAIYEDIKDFGGDREVLR